jgi:hypothetical protein
VREVLKDGDRRRPSCIESDYEQIVLKLDQLGRVRILDGAPRIEKGIATLVGHRDEKFLEQHVAAICWH